MRTGVLSAVTCLAALVIGGGFVALSPEGTVALKLATQNTKNCLDFPTQAAAQDYYRQQVGDPDNLDANNDGVACESFINKGRPKGYDKGALVDRIKRGVVDPDPPTAEVPVTPPAPSTATADPIAVETAPPNTDRPRSDVEK